MTPTNWLDAVWESDLPSNSKLIAAYLRKYLHGNKLMCYPSKIRIMAETGLTKKTVRKHIDHLEAEGWIKIKRSKGGTNNQYTIQGKNVTGAKCTPIRVDNDPVDRVNITPLKTNIKTNKKYITKKSVFDRLTDKNWSEGLVK